MKDKDLKLTLYLHIAILEGYNKQGFFKNSHFNSISHKD